MKMKRILKNIRKPGIRGSKDEADEQHHQQQQQQQQHRHQQTQQITGDVTGHERNVSFSGNIDALYEDDTFYTDDYLTSGGGGGGGGGGSSSSPQSVQRYSTGLNDSGHRTTTTTVRVPPPQQLRSSPNKPSSALMTAMPTSEAEHEELLALQASKTTTELTRTLVKRFIADIWNRGEIDLIPDVCSPSLRFNGNTGFDRVGHDGLARMVATIRDALDEYHCEIHSMVVEDNKAFCRLRFTGKHSGKLLGYKPTGKTVAWMGATEFTCQNGKILKVWELGDVKTLEEQLMNTTTTTTGAGEQEQNGHG